MVTVEQNEIVNKSVKSGELIEVRKIITNNFSWVKDKGVIINAGSTIGGAIGHDVDMVTILDHSNPEKIFDDFAKSIESMKEVIRQTDQLRPTFSFSRVAWQDFLTEIKKSSDARSVEPLGIHFLWYSSPSQLIISEPRALALGLAAGEVLVGNSQIADKVKDCCPDEETCNLWRGLDNVLDPIRLVANPNIKLSKLVSTIGHTIERFVTWDILADKVRREKGFDLVTREDIKQESAKSNPILKSVLARAREMRDMPKNFDEIRVMDLAQDIIENWTDLRGLK